MSASALRAIAPSYPDDAPQAPAIDDVLADLRAILAAFELQRVRRYFRQHHWTEESAAAEAADRLEPGLKLENVAAHSWHVADCALLLSPHFPELDPGKAAILAILHDKLEMITGDFDPVGPGGRGLDSHAFDTSAAERKAEAEARAVEIYLSTLAPAPRSGQLPLLQELVAGTTAEARFIKAVDKLQALAFVLKKKDGVMSDEHLAFTLKYSMKALHYWPRLANHYWTLVAAMLGRVAAQRSTTVESVEVQLVSAFERYLRGA